MGGGTQTPAQRGGAFAPYKRFEPTAQNLGGGGIYFRRAFQFLTVTIKITTPFGVVIFMARGDNPNPLRSFAIFLEKHPTGLLAGGAFAPYKRFAAGKTLAQGEFTSPEHFNH